jgi:hypothetical protein
MMVLLILVGLCVLTDLSLGILDIFENNGTTWYMIFLMWAIVIFLVLLNILEIYK